MLCKLNVFVVISLVVSMIFLAPPAQADTKISNGVICSKLGQSIKSSMVTYKCAKNPYVNSSKLTWLSLECMNAYKNALDVKKFTAGAVAILKSQIKVLETGIAAQKTKRIEIQNKLDESSKRLIGAQSKLVAAKTVAIKEVLVKAVISWKSAVGGYTSKIATIDSTIKQLDLSRSSAVSKQAQLASQASDAKASARLLCTK